MALLGIVPQKSSSEIFFLFLRFGPVGKPEHRKLTNQCSEGATSLSMPYKYMQPLRPASLSLSVCPWNWSILGQNRLIIRAATLQKSGVRFVSVFLCQRCREIWREILVNFSACYVFPRCGCPNRKFHKKKCHAENGVKDGKCHANFSSAGAWRWSSVRRSGGPHMPHWLRSALTKFLRMPHNHAPCRCRSALSQWLYNYLEKKTSSSDQLWMSPLAV